MLAIVESSRSIRRTLLYNEQKVEEKQALLLDAHNFWQEKEDLTFKEKLQRLKDLAMRNTRSKANCIHFSVNFHPIDPVHDKLLVRIATEFMKAVDFEHQPWLVYRHHDAGHPHIHIVTTNIQLSGIRIPNDHRAPHYMAAVSRGIEKKYGLVRGQADLRQVNDLTLRQTNEPPKPAQRLVYGKTPTKTGIATVLDYVLDTFGFTSLDHLNAILSLYHVKADRGSVDGAMYENRGLYYRMIDEAGKKVGAPIKASAFEKEPTLNYLEKKFVLNVAREVQCLQRIENKVFWGMYGGLHNEPPQSLYEFSEKLYNDKISLIVPAFTQRPTRKRSPAPNPTPDDGHGFYYIDIRDMVIVRDTQLDPRCTAAAVLQNLRIDKAILTLLAEKQLTPTKADQKLLRSPDPAQVRNALLRLTQQHNGYRAKQVEQEQSLRQRQRQRLRQHL